MTFDELVTEAASRLNLTSTESLARLGSYINMRYRRLTSSLGLSTSRRVIEETEAVLAGATVVTFDLEKIELVYTDTRVLDEIQYEEFRIKSVETPRSGVPTAYAVVSTTADSITLGLFPTPSDNMNIMADGIQNAATLADDDVPNFPADFHDVLVLGAMADELFKMEKYGLAKDKETDYEKRASDLRLFLAKSTYLSAAEVDAPGGFISVVRRKWR